MATGKLVKLKIEAYTSPKFEGKAIDTFTAMFNPNSYSLKYEAEYSENQGKGASASPQAFSKIKPLEFNLEFMLDGTGISSTAINVADEIEHFLKVASKINGDIHRPNFLIVSWGTLLSKCVLKSTEVTYTLFKPDGKPLRAKIVAIFAEQIEDEKRAKKDKLKSPDLTHIRETKASDLFSLMVYNIYRNQDYYVQVAEQNHLNTFRKIPSGQKLRFPPVAVSEH